MKALSDAILENCDALFEIDLRTNTYKTVKPLAMLGDSLASTGSYDELCKNLIFTISDSGSHVSEHYALFAQRGTVRPSFFKHKIMLRDKDKLRFFAFLFLPDVKNHTAFVLLTELQSPQHIRDLEALQKQHYIDASYLYSMVVDLDQDICRDAYVSELHLAGQSPVKLSFSEWRRMLLSAFNTAEKKTFLKKTDPEYIRAILDDEQKKFSFDIRMYNLSEELIWTRHTVARMIDVKQQHFLFLYTVQDIDSEKKQYDQEMETLIEGSAYDSVTNVYNREAGLRILENAIAATEEKQRSSSVICLTLKNMLDIRATFLHHVSESILKDFSSFIQNNIPEDAALCHYSTPTFLCILEGTNLEAAYQLARQLLEKHKSVRYQSVGQLSLGVGVVTLHGKESLDETLLRMDKISTATLETASDSLVSEQDISSSLFKRNSDIILNQVETEIHEHYASKLTLKDLSAKHFMNSAYLGQLFIQRHGISFNEYLWNVRLSHAAFLLVNTDRYIYEIIEEVGCTNVNYFNQQFSGKYGMSPTRYRKTYRQKD